MASTILALDHSSPMIELNTTPLIDVLLVLLVMLIITIPPQSHSLRLDLPGPPPVAPPPKTDVNLLEITRAGALLWNGQPIARDALRYDLARTQQMQPIPELHLHPEAEARYASVADVLGILNREQVRKFGFVGNEVYSHW